MRDLKQVQGVYGLGDLKIIIKALFRQFLVRSGDIDLRYIVIRKW